MFAQHALVRSSLKISVIASALLAAGCTGGRTTMIHNSDPELRKPSVAFAADAAKRAYPTDAPRGGDAQAQAAVDYGFFNRIDVSNLSDTDWTNVEVWVNQTYVVFVPNWRSKEMKHIDFTMLYDREGHNFPTNNRSTKVEKLEIARDGKVFTVPAKLAD